MRIDIITEQEKVYTRFRLTHPESEYIVNAPIVLLTKKVKETTRYKYYVIEGDIINGRKENN